MKKLLTLLLTLVMAVCLINLNNNHTKAEEINAETFGIILNSDGTMTKSTGGAYTNDKLTYNSQTSEWEMNGFDFETTNGYAIQISSNTTISIKGTNNIKVSGNNGDAVIKRDGTASNIKLTIKSFDGSNTPVLNVTNSSNAINATGIYLQYDDEANTLEIISGTVKVTSTNSQGIRTGELVIKDAYVYGESQQGEGIYVMEDDGLSLDEKGVLEASGPAAPILFTGNDLSSLAADLNSKYDVIGKGNTTLIPTKALFASGPFDVYVKISSTGEQATYAKITKKQTPTPTPSPSEPVVKDESCEKVIGPTWHWNNDKGICEEYSTVGTSTR